MFNDDLSEVQKNKMFSTNEMVEDLETLINNDTHHPLYYLLITLQNKINCEIDLGC